MFMDFNRARFPSMSDCFHISHGIISLYDILRTTTTPVALNLNLKRVY